MGEAAIDRSREELLEEIRLLKFEVRNLRVALASLGYSTSKARELVMAKSNTSCKAGHPSEGSPTPDR